MTNVYTDQGTASSLFECLMIMSYKLCLLRMWGPPGARGPGARAPMAPLLIRHCLDTLERRRQHHMMKTLHKVFYAHVGINIPAWIITSQRNNLKFVQPASRINCHLYSFYPRAIRFWNLLPFNIRNMKDVDAFTNSLTTAVVERLSSQSHAQRRRL